MTRAQESKVIQQKSVAIRDFVARKMTDLERQNEEFKEDNAELRNQVQILRARLNTLSSPAARELHRLSVTVILSSIMLPLLGKLCNKHDINRMSYLFRKLA